MLTCEEITQKARAIAPKITRSNCDEVSDKIIPYAHISNQITREELLEARNMPEYAEFLRASETTTDDWLDVLLVRATYAQYSAAVNSRIERG